MKRYLYLVIILLIWAIPSSSFSQSLGLSVNPSSITFPDADPDLVNSIPAPGIVMVSVSVSGIPAKQKWELTHRANGDLWSGSNTIDIRNITWTATPQPPFQNGTMSAKVSRTAGDGRGDISVTGSFQYFLKNQWDYMPGNYIVSTTFTLSSP